MAVSGTLGSLLQGVSQQPAHIRNDGQVTEQINMVSDVVEGLTSRPASVLDSYNLLSDSGLLWKNISIDGKTLQAGYKNGILELLDVNGIPQTITSDPDALSYMGTDMQSYVYDNIAYFINRDKITAMNPSTTASEALVVKDIGLCTILGGLFSHTYKLILEYTDGTKATGSYTAPDGTTSGDAAKTSSDYIANQLRISLAARPQIKAGTTVAVSGSVVLITGAPSLKLTASDGSGDETIRVQTNIALVLTDLAEFAPHGTLVRIVGQKGDVDDFWMRFDIDGATVGGSFGSEGVWQEWLNPFEPNALDLTTMPVVLSKTGATEYSLTLGDWQPRRVGDSTTNPIPGFVGSSFRDISGFQSRLVFISGSRVSTSRTNIPTDFFKQSASADVATDPIDLLSTSEKDVTLQWIVPFDRDLVVFGNSTQFLITGALAMTPTNASMVQTTNFDMSIGAKPVSTGRTVLFPFQSGGFAGVKEFYSANSVDANEAISITQVQDKYMKGSINNMISSTNFSFVLCQTDDPNEYKTIFVYKYYWDGEQKVQSSWSRWTFPYDVHNIFFEGSSLKILMYDDTLKYISVSVDLDLPAHPDTGYHVTLDIRDDYIVETSDGSYVLLDYVDLDYVDLGTASSRTTYLDLPWSTNVKLVQGAGCAVPGQIITPIDIIALGNGNYRYAVSKSTAPDGATVIAGLVYTKSITPTMPFIRDADGKAVKQSKLVITDFNVYYENSGIISTSMYSKYRTDPKSYSNSTIPVANDPNDPLGNGIRSGELTVPWGEQSDWSELTLSSNDVRPMTLIDVEWIGQTLIRGRRL